MLRAERVSALTTVVAAAKSSQKGLRGLTVCAFLTEDDVVEIFVDFPRFGSSRDHRWEDAADVLR